MTSDLIDAAKRVLQADIEATHDAAVHQDGPLIRAAGKASELADQPPLIILSTMTILVGVVARQPALARGGVRMLASHLVATGVKTVLKNAVDRARPSRALEQGEHLGRGTGSSDPSLNSFPSGHTAGIVAVAEAAAQEAPMLAGPVRAAAAIVGILQPSRGKHYGSDVVAGAAIGWLSERVTAELIDQAEGWATKVWQHWQDRRRPA